MIHSTQQSLTLSVPLTLASHHRAQLFYQQQSDPHKAKQIYLNTLAVAAVRTYLGWLGIASDLQASDSSDPVVQTLADIADLEISGQGKLECRPVLPEATTCYIPPGTIADRIGYLPVRLDAALRTATLLGFIPSADINVDTQEVPLAQLSPITSLFEYIRPQPGPVNKRVCLKDWLEGTFASGWQSLEALLEPQPIFSFRSLELSNPNDTTSAAIRGKLLELTPPSTEHQSCRVAFIVNIAPNDALQSNIWIRLCPVAGDRYLPEDLEVRILDNQDTVVMEAQSRQTDMIQLHFRGVMNERFAVEVALNGASLVEKFVI